MRRFHSYGPVDPDQHYCVPRTALIEQCVSQLVGNPDKGGHFFTIWAPRQTGKTWLMRRAIEELRARHGDRFLVGAISMQSVVLKDEGPPEEVLGWLPELFSWGMQIKVPRPADWKELAGLFRREAGVFDRPLILLIDEFDKLPPAAIDKFIGAFRDLYLTRETSLLHGLALIGVRAVLGVESPRGSPFNVQRSLHVPNLTRDEVRELFRQFQEERGQAIEPQVVEALYDMTRGQPGLVGWFAELLTEKYNPGPRPIDMGIWQEVYAAACQIEHNNTMLNLLKKAQGPYLPKVLEIFGKTNVPFSYGQEWCNYLSLNGIIDTHKIIGDNGLPLHVCRFSSPFVQQRLFNDLSKEIVERVRDLPLDPMDTLADVFAEAGPKAGIDVPALLRRYVAFLGRLHKKGADPWPKTLNDQPRRADLRHTEAVGHFHLYWWLTEACARLYLLTPEFPTGNGKVDLHIQYEDRAGLIEVKSFTSQAELAAQKAQAARYAASRGLLEATLALFVPSDDEELIQELSRTDAIQIGAAEVRIHTVAVAAQ